MKKYTKKEADAIIEEIKRMAIAGEHHITFTNDNELAQKWGRESILLNNFLWALLQGFSTTEEEIETICDRLFPEVEPEPQSECDFEGQIQQDGENILDKADRLYDQNKHE